MKSDPASVTDAFRAAAESEANSRISAGALFRTPDYAALNAALATVREGPPSRGDGPYTYREATEIVARELVRLIDAGEVVRVKGLDFVEDKFPNGKHIDIRHRWTALTAGTKVIIEQRKGYGYGDEWEVHFVGSAPIRLKKCKSSDEAFAFANTENRARLAAALEPLFAKEVEK